MSVSTSNSPAALPRRRVKYTEQPFPASTTAYTEHSSTSAIPATRSGPSFSPAAESGPPVASATTPGPSVNLVRRNLLRKLPEPFETSRRTGGRPLRPSVYEHDSATAAHPHTCDSLDCAMVKAMNTIEILEHVCTFLAPIQVLRLQLVNKKWRALVVHSPKLCFHLFIEPQWSHPAMKFQLLLLGIPGLEIKRGNPVHLGQWVEVRMNLAAAKEISATLEKITATAGNIPGTLNGAFLRLSRPFNDDFQTRRPAVRFVPPIPLLQPNHADLFITQPPLKGMQAFLVDAHGASLEAANPEDTVEPAHAKMSCDAGITLGFLTEVAVWMFEKRKRSLQGEDHQNKVAVFKAIVSFCVQSDAAPRMRSATRTVTEIESLQ